MGEAAGPVIVKICLMNIAYYQQGLMGLWMWEPFMVLCSWQLRLHNQVRDDVVQLRQIADRKPECVMELHIEHNQTREGTPL